jgi:hypothetical protein
MRITRHTVTFDGDLERLWAAWSDVSRWSEWDEDLEFAELAGPFAEGQSGRLKSRGGPAATFVLTRVEPRRSFCCETRLPLGTRLVVDHRLEVKDGASFLTHEADITGPLAAVFAALLGSSLRRATPRAMTTLLEQTRRDEAV